MNVSKTEIAQALNILLSAINEQINTPEIGSTEQERLSLNNLAKRFGAFAEVENRIKQIDDIEKVTGLVIHDVCNLYMEADRICKRYDMDFEQAELAMEFAKKINESDYDFDDAFSTLLKVNALDSKWGDLNDIEETLNHCKESAEWWAEHGNNADEMVDLYDACNRFNFDESQIVDMGRFFRNNDYNDLSEAYEVMDAMEGHDADDAAAIMQLVQESDITHGEAMDAIRFYEKHRVMIARYEAIVAIVSPEPSPCHDITATIGDAVQAFDEVDGYENDSTHGHLQNI